jgi:hypothetical protein
MYEAATRANDLLVVSRYGGRIRNLARSVLREKFAGAPPLSILARGRIRAGCEEGAPIQAGVLRLSLDRKVPPPHPRGDAGLASNDH